MKTTKRQQKVLAVLNPSDGLAKDHLQVADDAGLSDRGAQLVLYHLVDAGLADLDDFGYYLTPLGQQARD